MSFLTGYLWFFKLSSVGQAVKSDGGWSSVSWVNKTGLDSQSQSVPDVRHRVDEEMKFYDDQQLLVSVGELGEMRRMRTSGFYSTQKMWEEKKSSKK